MPPPPDVPDKPPRGSITRLDYAESRVALDAEVTEPSYGQCLSWMKGSPRDAPATLDYWARGNFTRRLLHNRKVGRSPLLVEVESVAQMRWAYRRLALLGLSVDFLYRGPITIPQKLLHALPLEPDTVFDCGWGYIGTISEVDRKLWLQLIGTARLLPNDVTTWLVEEVPAQFSAGSVFVAPGELVGIGTDSSPEQGDARVELATVCRGTSVVTEHDQARLMFALALPFIDGMSATDFATLLRDEANDLQDLREAFRAACGGSDSSESGLRHAVEHLAHEVSEVTRGARFERLRTFVRLSKGSIGTFEATLGALGAASATLGHDPFAGAAVLVGATKVVRDLWKQAAASEPDLSRYKLRVFWKLGFSKLAMVETPPGRWLPKHRLSRADHIDPHHWLPPPTPGIELAVVRKDR